MNNYNTFQTLLAMNAENVSPQAAYNIIAATEINEYRGSSTYNLISDLIHCVEQAHNGLNQQVAGWMAEVLVLAYRASN